MLGHGSVNTIERDRNTLKEIIDDVRGRSQTLHVPQRKISVINRKKALQSKRLLNFSQQPEVIFTNVVLYKEQTSKLYLAKYSVIEHGGRVLHVITMRDMSNEIFEALLERQSNLFVEELYRHLNFTEISQVISKSLIQLKELKHHVPPVDHRLYVRPIRLNLRLFNYLLHDIFDIRSLQQRTFTLQKDFFDLQQVLQRVKKMTIEYRSDISFSFYYDPRIPIQIINDSERICQILTNLLVNTCKLVNTSKIFLKAKLSDSTSPLQFIKVIVENRELKKPQKEQILNAFLAPHSSPAPDSLAFHFSITNLLAKQVSNNKHQLKVVSNNSSNYLKFKFQIYLFPDTFSSLKPLNQTPNSPSPNNQLQQSHIKNSKESHQSPNSLSHLDYENISEEGGTHTPQTSKLDKGHIKNISDEEPYKLSQQTGQSSSIEAREHQYQVTAVNQIKTIEPRPMLLQTKQVVVVNDNQHSYKDGTLISMDQSETSERGDQHLKAKGFDQLNSELPVKFIQGINQL